MELMRSFSDSGFILAVGGMLCIAALANCQTLVPPGNGTLGAAITAAKPGDVLQLTGGAIYTGSTPTFAIINKPITIEVQPGATQKAVIKLIDNADITKHYFYFMVMDGAKITLKGLDISGLSKDVTVGMSMLKFDGSPVPTNSKIGAIHIDDCTFHDFKDNIIHGMTDTTCKGLIEDSLIINNVLVYNASAFLQYKDVNLRHFEMTNSTVYRLEGLGFKIGKVSYRATPTSDSTITPTGFIDHCTLDDMGGPIHGHVEVDMAFHTFTVSNSIITNQDTTINQPPIYFISPQIDTAVILKNNCFWKDGGTNMMTGPNWLGYVWKDSITMDPSYKDPSNGDFTLPENSPLRTFGTDGGPIGDPRWTDHSASTKQVLSEPEYPRLRQINDPLNHLTTIQFTLVTREEISLKIFDLFGKEVKTLATGLFEPGIHKAVFDAAGISTGAYFCRMRVGKSNVENQLMLPAN